MKKAIREVIVVEGRYDKNALSQVVDATIITLGGFAVFNDKEKQTFLRKLAKRSWPFSAAWRSRGGSSC